jgi:hypothetical protein
VARVFVSHASADLAAAVEIRTWLRDAGHQVFLDRDLAEGIHVGEEWKRRLYKELRAADAVVCVLTDAYRSSEWCSAEVGIADMLGCPLLPVRAGAGVTSALLDGLQYADAHADPGRAQAELIERLGAVDRVGGSGWGDDRSPYPGLKPFEADMARVFRGRSVEVRQLTGRLRSLGERAGGGLLAVVGPSGCGKSSLVRAGLLPAMAGEAGWETAVPFTPGTDPVAALGRALAATANRAGMGWGGRSGPPWPRWPTTPTAWPGWPTSCWSAADGGPGNGCWSSSTRARSCSPAPTRPAWPGSPGCSMPAWPARCGSWSRCARSSSTGSTPC